MTACMIWIVQNFDQTLGTYTNLDAAKAHGEHVVQGHFRPYLDRNRVPASHRVVDWRLWCCGHLLGPGRFNHSDSQGHAEGCTRTSYRTVGLDPFWAADGKRAGTGHTSTAWQIWQGVAYDQFDPSMAA